MAQAKEMPPPDLDRAEAEFALDALGRGDVVRVLIRGTGRVALCTNFEDVRAAQRGRIPPDAVRLDRGRIA